MENIRRKYDSMVDLSKFTFNKKTSSKVLSKKKKKTLSKVVA